MRGRNSTVPTVRSTWGSLASQPTVSNDGASASTPSIGTAP